MKQRHLNFMLLIAALIGGVIGYVLGEIVVKRLQYQIPSIVLVGIYFAIFSTCVLVMCFLAECSFPRLTSYGWRDKYKGKMFAFAVPAVLIGFFVLGCLFQFIYSLGTVKSAVVEEPDDYIFLVDQSGSMYGSRAENTAVAMNNLIDTLPDEKQAGVIVFNSEAQVIAPLQSLNDTVRNTFKSTVTDAMNNCNGGTYIQNALETALDQYSGSSSDRKGCVVLVSDGIDSLDVKTITDEFNANSVSLFVVGVQMGMRSIRTFEELADETGGRYYDAQTVEQLDSIFKSIGTNIQKSTRLLIDHRYGLERNSMLYGIMRVIMFCLLGIALGVALGLLFDSKSLMINFMLGGVLTGLLAGLCIEIGCRHYWNIGVSRFISDVMLSLVISLFSAVFSYEITQQSSGVSYSSDSLSSLKGNLFNGNSDVHNGDFIGHIG